MKGKRIITLILVVLFAVLSIAAVSMDGDTKEITAKALDDHECDDTEWHFIINQISSEDLAPETITVKWINGDIEIVEMGKWEDEEKIPGFTGGVAHYTTKSNLDSSVEKATAWIYSEWNGEFNLSHGPCHQPTPTPTQPRPTNTPTKTKQPTITNTPTNTQTPFPTPTGTLTITPTLTLTITPTLTWTSTPQNTPTPREPTPTDHPPGGDEVPINPWRPGGSALVVLILIIVLSYTIHRTAKQNQQR